MVGQSRTNINKHVQFGHPHPIVTFVIKSFNKKLEMILYADDKKLTLKIKIIGKD